MIRKEAVSTPHVIRWSKDGNAFFVDDEEFFVARTLPKYGFKASKMQSFQRNLNIYGFTRYECNLKCISCTSNCTFSSHPDLSCFLIYTLSL